MSKIKFCVFSDFHRWEGHHFAPASAMDEILEAAHKEKVDFIIHCGDFCHNSLTDTMFVHRYQNNPYGLKTYGCLGNHEQEDVDSVEEVCKLYGMEKGYAFFDEGDFRIIILDSNYYLNEYGEIVHNPPYTHSSKNGDRIGEEQLAWLREVIALAPGKCLLFSHASFELDCFSPDAAKVRRVIAEANKREKHKVLLCCNGHYHRNSIRVVEEVAYFDVNAVYNIDWNPGNNFMFPEEFKQQARMICQHCYSNEPLFAIVTVEDNGHITVKGRVSDYMYQASPEKLGWKNANKSGRIPAPVISDAEIQL